MQRRLGRLLAGGGLLVILVLTLIPLPSQTLASEATPIWCLVCGEYGGVDVIANVLLFIPLGLGLRLLDWRPKTILLAATALALTIEFLQLELIPGRDASLSDLITNTAGSGIGAILGSRWRMLLYPTKVQALRLALVGGILWLALQLGTGLLLRPWLPEGTYRSEWSPRNPLRARFTGQILWARVAGLPAPEGVLPRQAASRLARGDIELGLAFRTEPALTRWSALFHLMGPDSANLLVESHGTSLVFQAPAWSQRLRLRRPRLLLPASLPPDSGVIVRLRAGERNDTIWARISGDRSWQRYHVLSPSHSWSLIVPFSYSYGPEVPWITGAWIVMLMAPLAYWFSRRFDGYAAWATMGFLLVAGLALVPYAIGFPPVHQSEWLAGVLGTATGWSASRVGLYLRERCDSPSTKESC